MRQGEKHVPSSRKANRGPSAGPENRRALIAAAWEVFAADGLQAPFSAVAKRAGVGQGSLYRHFPDRPGHRVDRAHRSHLAQPPR